MLTTALIGAASAALAADAKVEEQIVGPAGQDTKYVVSPRGGHLASVARKGSRMNVVVDGVAGPKVDEVITPVLAVVDPRRCATWTSDENNANQPKPVTFSRDGSRYAYLARVGQEWILMADGKEVLRLPAGGAVGGTTGIGGMAGNTDIRIEFSGDGGKHLFFARSSFAGYELWVDGQKMPGFYASAGTGDDALDPVISPDGDHFAYVAALGTHPGDRKALFLDGKDTGYLGDHPRFSADSQHLICMARSPKGQSVLVDGKSLFSAKEMERIYVSPVGNRIIAVLTHFGKDGATREGQFLLANGKPVEASLCEQVKRVIFSPDGKRYAAICGRPGAVFVVLDGKKGQEYQFIDEELAGLSCGLRFSADSSKVGYVAHASGKGFVVINDDESDAFDNSPTFLFSPDSKRVVMQGMRGQSYPLFVDGKAEKRARAISLEGFSFSPDVKRYAYYAGGTPRDGGPVVVDGKATDLTGSYSFSPDSKHVVVVGYRATDNKRGIFLDGQLVFPAEMDIIYRAFTPDSQHLYWMAREAATGPDAVPGSYEFVNYLDGRPVAHGEQRAEAQAILLPRGFGHFAQPPPAWDLGPDGTLTCMAVAGDAVKRIKVTPSAETGLTTMLAKAGTETARNSAER